MSISKKITVKHFLNHRLKSVNGCYPIYTQVITNRKTAQFKSEFQRFIKSQIKGLGNKYSGLGLELYNEEEFKELLNIDNSPLKIEQQIISEIINKYQNQNEPIQSLKHLKHIYDKLMIEFSFLSYYFIDLIRLTMESNPDQKNLSRIIDWKTDQEILINGLKQIFNEQNSGDNQFIKLIEIIKDFSGSANYRVYDFIIKDRMIEFKRYVESKEKMERILAEIAFYVLEAFFNDIEKTNKLLLSGKKAEYGKVNFTKKEYITMLAGLVQEHGI